MNEDGVTIEWYGENWEVIQKNYVPCDTAHEWTIEGVRGLRLRCEGLRPMFLQVDVKLGRAWRRFGFTVSTCPLIYLALDSYKGALQWRVSVGELLVGESQC